ncbi:MAG: MerR family transcriptional regulator [Anaerolineae bacterium]|nr:MerR family transcriptional regulator [Anaerolineae bacterium]
MSNPDTTPTFNLKAVVQETGIKPDTLRAWERRYGLPQPQRTSGGHRLYSQHDIDMLKWLLARQEEGLSISRAVDMWNKLEEEGESPLSSFEQVETGNIIIEGETVSELRHLWIEACLQFDEIRAKQTLSQAFALFPTQLVCFELLQKGLVEVGNGWYEGRISVQQEHFASAQAVRQLEALLNAAPSPTKNGRLLIACAPEEQHTFSTLLLTLLLRHRGWDVVYLGANVPVDRLETAVDTVQPVVLIVTAQTLYTAGKLLAVATFAQEKGLPLAFGGGVFTAIPETVKHIPGYFLGNDLHTAPQSVEQVVNLGRPSPAVALATADYLQALDQFISSRAAIDAQVIVALADVGIPLQYLKNANRDLGDNIIAALTLGDMGLLAANIEWIQGLLVNFHYRMPEDAMTPYLKAYKQAAQKHLTGPVSEWLARV